MIQFESLLKLPIQSLIIFGNDETAEAQAHRASLSHLFIQ